MNLYKFNYRVNDSFHVITLVANYENEALHKILNARLNKEKGVISLKKCKQIYDF